MYCENCNHPLNLTDKFCGNCGAPNPFAQETAQAPKKVEPPRPQPGQGTRPVTTGQPGQGTRPVTPGQPGQGTRPVTPGQPGQGTRPVAPGQPGQGTRPVAPGQPGQGTRPVAPGQPGQGTRPVTPGQPGQGTRPVAPGQPGQGTRPVTPDQPGQGTRPVTPGPTSVTTVPASKKKLTDQQKKALLAIPIVFGVMMILLVSVVVYAVTNTLDHTAESFAKAVDSENWGKVYALMDMKDSDFVSKDAFISACKNGSDPFRCGEVEGYTLYGTKTASRSAARHSYNMECYDSQGYSSDLNFSVFRKKDGFLFFDKYAVEPSVSPIPSYSIYAPPGCTVTVTNENGKAAAVEPYIGEDDPYDEYFYYIDAILPGTYSISVKHNMCIEHTGSFRVYPNGYDDGYEEWLDSSGTGSTTNNSYIVHLSFTDTAKTSVCNLATNYGAAILRAAADETGQISNVEFADEDCFNQVQDTVNDLAQDLKDASSGGYTYSKIRIDSFKVSGDSRNSLYYNEYIAVTFDLSYTVNWMYSSYCYSDSGSKEYSGKTILYLADVDGAWKVADMDLELRK